MTYALPMFPSVVSGAEPVCLYFPPMAAPDQEVPIWALHDLPRLRAEAEATIERLLTFLDLTETDCDLEPSLGYYPPGYLPDVEYEHDGREPDNDTEDDHDFEPSLGSINTTIGGSQSYWAAGGDADREGDPLDLGELDDPIRGGSVLTA